MSKTAELPKQRTEHTTIKCCACNTTFPVETEDTGRWERGTGESWLRWFWFCNPCNSAGAKRNTTTMRLVETLDIALKRKYAPDQTLISVFKDEPMIDCLISGKVIIDKDYWIIISPERGQTYDIAPHTMDTERKCFDWLAHLSKKGFITPQMMYDLVILFNAYLKYIGVRHD